MKWKKKRTGASLDDIPEPNVYSTGDRPIAAQSDLFFIFYIPYVA